MEISSIETFIKYYRRIRERTVRIISCIPPEKIEWTYREGKWTLGDLIRHLAALERFMFAENILNKPSRYPGCGKELAEGYDRILDYLNTMHEETLAIFRQLSDADLQRKCITPNGTKITIWKWLRAMVEHEIHHRGQIYLYLSMLDVVTPPLYGLTSEEVLKRSHK